MPRARLVADDVTLTTSAPKKASDGRSIVLASLPRSIQVTFTMERRCEFGEHYAVVGEVDELRFWDPAKAVVAQWSEGHHWRVTVDLPADRPIEFKFVLLGRHGEVWWQPGRNHVLATAGLARSVDVHVPWDTEQPLVVVNHPERSTSSGSLNGALTAITILEDEKELVAESSEITVNGRSSLSMESNGHSNSGMESDGYSNSGMEFDDYSLSGMESNGYSYYGMESNSYSDFCMEFNGLSDLGMESNGYSNPSISGVDLVIPAEEDTADPSVTLKGAARGERALLPAGRSNADNSQADAMEKRGVLAAGVATNASFNAAAFNAAESFPTISDLYGTGGVDNEGERELEYVSGSAGAGMRADIAGSVEAACTEQSDEEGKSLMVQREGSSSGGDRKGLQSNTGDQVKPARQRRKERKSSSKYLSELFFNDAHLPMRRWAGELYQENPSSTPTTNHLPASPALSSAASPAPSNPNQKSAALLGASHNSHPLHLATSGSTPVSAQFAAHPSSASSLTATLTPPAPGLFDGLGEVMERGVGRLFSRMQHSLARARIWLVLIPLPALSTPLAALAVAVQLFLLLTL
ncbi:hypothetical protein CLOP_g7099 [Closterium sp. NIES-67]|nr:hypothetical protein CLOP_g7099 [Closterium sp. NIES-67]